PRRPRTALDDVEGPAARAQSLGKARTGQAGADDDRAFFRGSVRVVDRLSNRPARRKTADEHFALRSESRAPFRRNARVGKRIADGARRAVARDARTGCRETTK